MQVLCDRAGVSSAYSMLAACSRTRTRSMNGPRRAAALPRIPVVDRPRRSPRSARRPASRCGRRAGSSRRPPAPCWRGPAARTHLAGHPGLRQADAGVPHAGHCFARTWYSVTSGGGGGAASNTCRSCSHVAGTPARPCPQHRTPPDRTPPCHPGCRTASAWKTARRAACRASGRTCRATTCPSGFDRAGLSEEGGLDDVGDPCPAAAGVPLPARPAPRSARPRCQLRRGQLIAIRGRLPQPGIAASSSLPAHAAIRPGQTGIQAAYRNRPAVHQSRRSVTSTTRRPAQKSGTRPSPRPSPVPEPSSRTPATQAE